MTTKHSGSIIRKPHITEKGAHQAEAGVYVFEVSKAANKFEIAEAIREIYKVTPRQVRVVTIRKKFVLTRGTNRTGMTRGGKKAYVYLKKGDTIELA